MTLLSMCQNVARETGFPIPATIAGNNNLVARKLLAAANRTGKQLRLNDWCVLILEHTFETCANQDSYALPADFVTLVPRTTWNRTQNDPMGRLSPQSWQELKSGLTTSIAFDNFRIKATKNKQNKFFIDPTPDAVETVAFEYRSKNWVRVNNGTTFANVFANDADTTIIDEDLFELGIMWRFLQKQGEPYFDEKDEFDRTLARHAADDCGPEVISMVRRRIPFVANVGQINFGN